MNKTSPLFRIRFVRILGAILLLWLLQFIFFRSRSMRTATDSRIQKDRKDQAGEPVLTLVLASYNKTEDVGWPLYVLNRDVDTVVYTIDDDAPKSKNKIPKNKGRESMVYLSYIIDNYHTLPEIVVFMRAAQVQPHLTEEFFQGSMLKALEHLQTRKITRSGYFNLRCDWEPSCPKRLNLQDALASTDAAEPGEAEIMHNAIRDLMPAAQIPDWIAQPAGNQFAVSRESIQTVPLDLWKAWRKWLLATTLSDEQANRVWEYLWHYVFMSRSVNCPVVDQCYCEGYGLCFLSPTKFAVWRAWSREVQEWNVEYEKLQQQVDQGVAGARSASLDLKDKIDARNDVLKTALDSAISWGNELRDRGDYGVHYGGDRRPTMVEEGAMFGV